jgi:hypothetical protein
MELTREQLDRLKQTIKPMLGYLHRLQGRMDVAGFVPSDELYRAVTNARDALHALSVNLHYLACDARKRGKN